MRSVAGVLLAILGLTAWLGIGGSWSGGTVLSSVLTVGVLAWARMGVGAASDRRAFLSQVGALGLLYWGLSYASNLLEAAYFHVLPVDVAERGAVFSVLPAVLIACLLVWLLRPGAQVEARAGQLAGGMWWRVPVLCLCFFLIYLAAGAAIFPWIKSFYIGKPLPTLPALFRLQCVRGLFDVGCLLPWLGLYRGRRGRAVGLCAVLVPTLCGWAPLLLPNGYMPPAIRAAHAVEMGVSGIAFGTLAAWVLLRPSGHAPVKQDLAGQPEGLEQRSGTRG